MGAEAAAAAPGLTSLPQLRASKELVLTGAIDLARAAAEETATDASDVGDYAGVVIDGERLVTHYFSATMPGYPGWCWAVTLARAPRARVATICEVALLPQAGALLAPAWLPWSERLRPEDIGVGDVLPFRPDDPRLVPGWSGDDGADLGPSLEELAVARQRVLGALGTEDAAQRWYRGAHGPTAPVALAATAPCQSCAFLVRLSGSLGQMFGVCANEWAPDDGQVVSFDHGCGAHSETDVEPSAALWPESSPPIDDLDISVAAFEYETEPRAGSEGTADGEGAAGDEGAADRATAAEPELGAPASAASEQGEQPDAEANQTGGEPSAGDELPEQVPASQQGDPSDEGSEQPDRASD